MLWSQTSRRFLFEYIPLICFVMMDQVLVNKPSDWEQWRSYHESLLRKGWTLDEIRIVLAQYEGGLTRDEVNKELKQYFTSLGRSEHWILDTIKDASDIPWEFNKKRLIDIYTRTRSVKSTVAELEMLTKVSKDPGSKSGFAFNQRTANDRLKDWGIVLSNKKKPIQSMNTSSGGSVPSAPRANEAIQNDDSGPREGMSELGAMHEPHLEGFEPSNDMQMRRGELSTPSTPMQLHETTDAMATLSHAATTKNTMSQQGSTSQPQLESSEQSEDLQNQRGVPPSPPPLHMTANSTTNFSSTATPMNLDGNYPESQQLMSGPTIDASQRQDENHPLNQPRGTIRPHDMHINSEIQRQMMMCQEAKESYNRAKREWDYLLALVAGLEKQVDELKASDSSNKAEIHRLETQLYRAREDVKALRIKNRQATTRHGQKLENTRKEYEKERRQLESLKLSYEAVKKSHDEACRLWQTPVPTDSGVAMDSPTSYLLASPNILMPVRVEELTEPPSSLDRVGRGRPLNSDNAKKDALTALIKELDILVKTGRGEHLPDSQDAANRMDSSRQEWL